MHMYHHIQIINARWCFAALTFNAIHDVILNSYMYLIKTI